MTVIDTLPHKDAILLALTGITGLGVYDGEVAASPPLDPDGRVHPYGVLYLSAGNPVRSALVAVSDHLDLSFQVTAAGGDVTRALWAADKVRAALLDKTLTVSGRSLGTISADGDSGPIRRDDGVTPPRHWLALLFRVVSVPA